MMIKILTKFLQFMFAYNRTKILVLISLHQQSLNIKFNNNLVITNYMLKKQLNKSIRSISNSKKKHINLVKNRPKILQLFEADKKHSYKYPSYKKSIGSSKKEISKSQRINTSTYQFPQFSIKFQQGTHRNDTINKRRQLLKLKNKNSDSFFVYKKVPKDIKKSPKQFVKKVSSQYLNNSNESSDKKDKLFHQYKTAINKIFKALDIFDRGQISEINLNKCVPQSAFYFLGKVFQKIKQFQLALSEPQFQDLSKPLFNQSSEQDIKWFINQINNKDNIFKISIKTNDSIKKEELSPIEKRMMKQQFQMSKDRLGSNTKNSYLNQVIDLIKDKQNQTLQKLKIVKQKQRNIPFNILGQLNSNQYMIKYRNQVQEIKMKKNDNYKQINQSQFSHQKIIKNNLKSSIQRSSYSGSIRKNNDQKQNQQVPNFTLQLPKQIKPQLNVIAHTITINSDQQFFQQKKDSIVVQKYSNSFIKQDKLTIVNTNSRFTKEPCSGVKISMITQENQRLDKLSNKLQEYIKLNRTKIQNSMDFIRSNSRSKI